MEKISCDETSQKVATGDSGFHLLIISGSWRTRRASIASWATSGMVGWYTSDTSPLITSIVDIETEVSGLAGDTCVCWFNSCVICALSPVAGEPIMVVLALVSFDWLLRIKTGSEWIRRTIPRRRLLGDRTSELKGLTSFFSDKLCER